MTQEDKDKKANKPSDSEKVAAYLTELEHPLKAEIEAVRTIILGANAKIKERIKWAAPSYYYGVDLLTFNPRMKNKVHLIFHDIAIVNVASPLLEGDYKDRRMMYFENMDDVQNKQQELERILNEYVEVAEAQNS